MGERGGGREGERERERDTVVCTRAAARREWDLIRAAEDVGVAGDSYAEGRVVLGVRAQTNLPRRGPAHRGRRDGADCGWDASMSLARAEP